MEYLIIYQNCGEELPGKCYMSCDSDKRVFTKLYLFKYDGVDEDANWDDEEVKEALEELREEVADDNNCSISEVTNEDIEVWCEEYINSDEDGILLIYNVDNKEEIVDNF